MIGNISSGFPLADPSTSIKQLRHGPASKGTAEDSERIQKAAEQFEAMLIGQMLKTAREAGLSDKSKDQGGQTEMQLADEKFASLIASKGGLGLAKFITSNLVPKS